MLKPARSPTIDRERERERTEDAKTNEKWNGTPKIQRATNPVFLSLCPPKRQLCPHPSDLVGDSDGEKEAMKVEKEREKGLPACLPACLRRLGT